MVSVRKVYMPAFKDHADKLKGGQWYREAVKAIAEDMLACRAVQVQENFLLEDERYLLTYVYREARPNRYLP